MATGRERARIDDAEAGRLKPADLERVVRYFKVLLDWDERRRSTESHATAAMPSEASVLSAAAGDVGVS
jgi:hypothetical protein